MMRLFRLIVAAVVTLGPPRWSKLRGLTRAMSISS
jgi:hypothetical protein